MEQQILLLKLKIIFNLHNSKLPQLCTAPQLTSHSQLYCSMACTHWSTRLSLNFSTSEFAQTLLTIRSCQKNYFFDFFFNSILDTHLPREDLRHPRQAPQIPSCASKEPRRSFEAHDGMWKCLGGPSPFSPEPLSRPLGAQEPFAALANVAALAARMVKTVSTWICNLLPLRSKS